MSTMTDRDVIAWARQYGALAAMMGDDDAAKLRRLADLAEKGAEDWQLRASNSELEARIEQLQEVLADRYESALKAEVSRVEEAASATRAKVEQLLREYLPAPPGGER